MAVFVIDAQGLPHVGLHLTAHGHVHIPQGATVALGDPGLHHKVHFRVHADHLLLFKVVRFDLIQQFVCPFRIAGFGQANQQLFRMHGILISTLLLHFVFDDQPAVFCFLRFCYLPGYVKRIGKIRQSGAGRPDKENEGSGINAGNSFVQIFK